MSPNPDLADIIGEKIEQAFAERGENIDEAFGGQTCADVVRVCTVREICRLLALYQIPANEVMPTTEDLPMDPTRGAYLAMVLNSMFTDESETLGIRVTNHMV